jgi:hypothetical protein
MDARDAAPIAANAIGDLAILLIYGICAVLIAVPVLAAVALVGSRALGGLRVRTSTSKSRSGPPREDV